MRCWNKRKKEKFTTKGKYKILDEFNLIFLEHRNMKRKSKLKNVFSGKISFVPAFIIPQKGGAER